MTDIGDRHFLDSSVVRSMLASTEEHRKHFRAKFADQRCYTSEFVRMEVRRSLLFPLIGFFHCMSGPPRKSLSDAIEFWKNKFAKSDHIALETLLAALFRSRGFDMNSLRDKDRALIETARYIRRIELKLRTYRDAGQNSVRCSRASVSLSVDMTKMRETLTAFYDDFSNTRKHEEACRVREFFCTRHRSAVTRYINDANNAPRPADEARGFVRLGTKLEQIASTKGDACSCKMCASVGDVVIALDAPRNQRLEHTDYSFNYLCPPINQPHQLHPSAFGMNRHDAEPA